ncbi:hypothetical protein B4099_3611 [Heyndrickxia coagulans]|uniref:Uncharacterized protein n=1 Tax=Heyndrickxia coagulans TaxID=1398 RepID=A0A150JVI4_HEYCO|nr:hypothetical protein B4099_3611 [Heyndrickxia coagulans]
MRFTGKKGAYLRARRKKPLPVSGRGFLRFSSVLDFMPLLAIKHV